MILDSLSNVNKELLKKAHLKAPVTTEILYKLKENGLDVVELTDEDITEHFSVIKKDIQADVKLIQGDDN